MDSLRPRGILVESHRFCPQYTQSRAGNHRQFDTGFAPGIRSPHTGTRWGNPCPPDILSQRRRPRRTPVQAGNHHHLDRAHRPHSDCLSRPARTDSPCHRYTQRPPRKRDLRTRIQPYSRRFRDTQRRRRPAHRAHHQSRASPVHSQLLHMSASRDHSGGQHHSRDREGTQVGSRLHRRQTPPGTPYRRGTRPPYPVPGKHHRHTLPRTHQRDTTARADTPPRHCKRWDQSRREYRPLRSTSCQQGTALRHTAVPECTHRLHTLDQRRSQSSSDTQEMNGRTRWLREEPSKGTTQISSSVSSSFLQNNKFNALVLGFSSRCQAQSLRLVLPISAGLEALTFNALGDQVALHRT